MASHPPYVLVPIVLATALLGGVQLTVAQGSHHQKRPAMAVEGKALDAAPATRAEAAEAIDEAVAAALIGAISAQFGEHEVEVKLDRVESDPLNLIDLKLSGEGHLRIGDDADWLPLRFTALYDSLAATVAQPRITVGDEGEGRDIAAASVLGRALLDQAAAQLKLEFARQPVRLRLDRIRELPASKRWLRLEGVGTVDFADQGSSVAHVRALYDRSRDEWLQVGYELGAGAAAMTVVPTAAP